MTLWSLWIKWLCWRCCGEKKTLKTVLLQKCDTKSFRQDQELFSPRQDSAFELTCPHQSSGSFQLLWIFEVWWSELWTDVSTAMHSNPDWVFFLFCFCLLLLLCFKFLVASILWPRSQGHRPPGWPSGKASASRAKDPKLESRLRWDFFGVKSYQWFKNWRSSGYPARCLALQGQRWD